MRPGRRPIPDRTIGAPFAVRLLGVRPPAALVGSLLARTAFDDDEDRWLFPSGWPGFAETSGGLFNGLSILVWLVGDGWQLMCSVGAAA